MSVSTISYDSGGFGPWLFQRDRYAASPSASDAVASADLSSTRFARGQAAASAPPAWPSPGIAAGGTVTSASAPQDWLSATESAAGTLIGDLQAFLADLQAGGAGGTAAPSGAATAGADAPAAAATPATATAPAATGTTVAAAATAATSAPASAGGGIGTGTGATTLISALQSFIAQLQAGPTNQAAPGGTTSAPPPSASAPSHRAGGGHHRHHGGGDGGSGGVFGELQTTNQLLGEILGAIETYSAQGSPSAPQASTTSVSA